MQKVKAKVPLGFSFDVHPNPFNPSTTLSYTLPTASHVTLNVYDINGRQICELANGWREMGEHQAFFDASGLASGIYFARLSARDFQVTQKLLLVK